MKIEAWPSLSDEVLWRARKLNCPLEAEAVSQRDKARVA